MYQLISVQTTTLHPRNSISLSPLRRGFLLIPLVLACFALSATARAQLSPAPDGGYPNNNTAEGTNALFSLTNGIGNTAIGFKALFNNTGGDVTTGDEGSDNTATGSEALFHNTRGYRNTANGSAALYSNTTGSDNTATGQSALASNKTGYSNTANGSGALSSNTAGKHNTANGVDALLNNTTGTHNTANGDGALAYNTTGNNNTATGVEALLGQYPSTGSNNTANGYRALYSYTTGHDNVANGVNALLNNSTGSNNTANGRGALNKNTTANNNTADGYQALNNNNTGQNNTATSFQALFSNTTGSNNTAIGENALYNSTGSGNIAVGINAGTGVSTGNDNIDIGSPGMVSESNKIRIGTVGVQNAIFVAGIYNVNEGGTIKAVYINSNGQLGTQAPASSRRFKKEIKPMDKASEAILALKPVTFQYKSDSSGTPQFGLIAEEVAKVNPDLVVRDENGEIYTVRYDAVNAMLLNEFLKERQKVEQLQKQVEALTAGLQKVSAQIEVTNPAPQTVLNNQ
jgi:hypothetical protein